MKRVLFLFALLACGPTTHSDRAPAPMVDPEMDAGGVDPGNDAASPITPACASDIPRSTPVTVLITPDDGIKPVLDLIGGAQTSIEITIYTLSSRALISALGTAAQRGVKVRVILDREQTNSSDMAQLAGLGIDAKLSDPKFTYTHQKTLTVDAGRTFVFSGNFDSMSFGTGRNYGVVDADPQDARDFGNLFEADWSGQSPDLSCTRLIIAPNNASTRLLDLLGRSTTTLDVEALYATDSKILSAIEAAHRRGVAVRVLFNDPQFGVGDASDEAGRLSRAGIPVRKLPVRFIHAKLLVVDGAWAFVGSENFSTNSLRYNREAGLLISKGDADVDRIERTFEGDWSAGVTF